MAVGEEHYTKQQVSQSIRWVLGLVIGTIALVLGIIMIASNLVRSHGGGVVSQNAAALTDAAVAARIKAVGEAKVDPNQPAAAPAGQAAPAADAAAAPAASAETPAAAPAADGKATYEQACLVCHGAGIAGSPKLGDKAAWGPRIATGTDTLYGSALKGKNAMPAKGGNAALSDEAVKAAVDYMLSQAQ